MDGVHDGGGEERHRRLLYEVMTDGALSYREKQRRALEIGVTYLGVENGHIERITSHEQHEVAMSVGGDGLFSTGELLDPSRTYCRTTLERDSPLALSNATDEGWEADPAYEEHGLACYLGSSIYVDDDAYGTLCFVSRHPRTTPFTASERTFVELAANLLGRELAFHDHRRTREQLGRAEQVATVGSWELDVETGRFEWTDGARCIYGVDPADDVTFEDAVSFVHPADRDTFQQAIDTCRETGEPWDVEVRLLTAEGRVRWVQSFGEVHDVGGIPKLCGAVREITDRKVREQRLSVLNRVLRHNLRNRLNLVTGHAELLRQELQKLTVLESLDDFDVGDEHAATPAGENAPAPEEPLTAGAALTDVAGFSTEHAETSVDLIVEESYGLLSLAEKTRRFDQVELQAGDTQTVPVEPLLADLRDEYRDRFPEATISVEGPPVAVQGTRDPIRLALSELLENALVHAGGDEPTVVVRTGEPTANRVSISVVDTGPGIPEQERAVVAGDEETSLAHGSGIGLWLVNWVVVHQEGSLTIRDNDPTGAVVTVNLPAAGTRGRAGD